MTSVLETGAYDTADTGTYEVLRDRLTAQVAELARRAEQLDARRTEEFGTVRLGLDRTERLRTEHAAVLRDLVAVGDTLLVGSSDTAGLDGEPDVAHVLELRDRALAPLGADAVPGLLDDPEFVREFTALHRYYRQARLLRLRRVGDRLLAVFRTGEKAEDIRVLRWALTADGRVRFLDARGERDDVFPPSHDVDWIRTTREDHVLGGARPAVRIQDAILVSTVGGTLTIADAGDEEPAELYGEPVDEPLQSLADAEIAHARVGALILLRVLPYKEDTERYFVFDTLTRGVVRLDGIGQACRRLPDDRGVVFPGGYCLAGGTHKTFDVDTTGLRFEAELRSPYGEDVLYAFRSPTGAHCLLLSYHTVREEVAAPLPCTGWARFDDGTLIVLREDGDEPARVHPLQLWTSPYASDTWAAAQPVGEGALARVGNADLVRGIADCLSLARTAAETTPTGEMYTALVAACVRAADTHHWLGEADLGDLRTPLDAVRDTAEQVLAEFDTVRTLTRQAADAVDEAAERLAAVVRRLRGETPRDAAAWVTGLTELRRAQGHLLTLKDLRYADTARIDDLAERAAADLDAFGHRAVASLDRDDAFAPQLRELAGLADDAERIDALVQAEPLRERIDELAARIRTVTEVVSGLDIADATVRTSVLSRTAEVLAAVNRARALLDTRCRTLRDSEGRAGFAAESGLLGQHITGALTAAGTPDECDEQLAFVLNRLEELESRFAEFDDFLAELADKRAEVYEAFAARKQNLLDARARRAEQLADAAARVLDAVTRRAATLPDEDAVSTWFASDPMVAKVRRTAEELRGLGDSVRAEELDGRLKAARQEARRALRDRGELYGDDGRTIRLGAHRFAVTTQPLDLTLVPHGDGLAFALTGTDYRAPVTDPALTGTGALTDRRLPSESPQVYRAEHLAARLLREHGADALASAGDLAALVTEAAREAYDEGYEQGVHDHDATLILTALLPLYDKAGLLRHEPAARAAAQLYWAHGIDEERRAVWTRRAVSMARARDTFGLAPAIADLRRELAAAIGGPYADAAAEYLFDELTTGPDGFVLAASGRDLLDGFRRTVDGAAFDADLAAVDDDAARRQLAEAWLSAYAHANGLDVTDGDLAEAVAAVLCPGLPRHVSDAVPETVVEGLLGTHPRISDRRMPLRVDEFLARTRRFADEDVPAFRELQRRRTALVAAERARLRLDELRPPFARVVRAGPAGRRGVSAAGRRQSRQAARHGRHRQAHRHRRSAVARLAARLRQDHADRVRRRPARTDAGEGQRPGPRSRCHLARPGGGPERHRTPGDREDQLRVGGRQQHPAVPGRHPAHLAGTAAEVHPAVRRHPTRGRRVERRAPHLRPARQAVRGGHGRQPLHRVRGPLPGAGHARQPRRRVEPGRCPHRQGGRVRVQLPGERAHLQPGARAARRAGPGRPRPVRATRRGRPDGPAGPAHASVCGGGSGTDRVRAAASAAGAGDRPRRQRRVHRLGRAVRRDPHRAAVPPPGFLPHHEQDRPADPARHERRRGRGRRRRPLHRRGADPHRRRRGQPAEAGRAARHAHAGAARAVGGTEGVVRPHPDPRRGRGGPAGPRGRRARSARRPGGGGRGRDHTGR
ncbi:hypothetical protein GCM10020256_35610 [Streptomyces thermocoprophilus]